MRIFLAILAGFVLWSALWLGGDPLLRQLFAGAYPADFPASPMTAVAPLLAILALSVLCSFASGWLTARLAGERRTASIALLAVLLLAVGIAVQSSIWHAMPLWYHLPFLALLAPMCWLGARRVGRPA